MRALLKGTLALLLVSASLMTFATVSKRVDEVKPIEKVELSSKTSNFAANEVLTISNLTDMSQYVVVGQNKNYGTLTNASLAIVNRNYISVDRPAPPYVFRRSQMTKDKYNTDIKYQTAGRAAISTKHLRSAVLVRMLS